MKKILSVILLVGVMLGCKDESLSPYLEPESNVIGFGQFVNPGDNSLVPPDNSFYDQGDVDAAIFFTGNDPASEVNLKLQWISVKQDLTVANIELYVEWDEAYTDDDRNQLTAAHGVGEHKPTYPNGKFWKTITASTASRTPVDIKITYADMYTLFQNEKYDYGTGEVDVFSAGNLYTGNTDRTTQRFYTDRTATINTKSVKLAADTFILGWRFIADDGRAFGTWYDSVCLESVGFSCHAQWSTE